MPYSTRAQATSKVPTESMFAAMIGTPVHSCSLLQKLYVRETSTCEREASVERFGRMSTSLKSSFGSVSMRIVRGSLLRAGAESLSPISSVSWCTRAALRALPLLPLFLDDCCTPS